MLLRAMPMHWPSGHCLLATHTVVSYEITKSKPTHYNLTTSWSFYLIAASLSNYKYIKKFMHMYSV